MFRTFLAALCLCPIILLGQSSVNALGSASDAAQRVFEGQKASAVSIDTSRVYDVTEVMERPAYPGSEAALMKVLTATEGCPSVVGRGSCSSTHIGMTFIVERDGHISDPTLTSSSCPALAPIARCSMNRMARWTPGKLRDIPVRVRMIIPVTYEIH